MSEFDEESVLAMKIDPKDSYLLAGDTAGFIAIFDIKKYCTSPHSMVSRFKHSTQTLIPTEIVTMALNHFSCTMRTHPDL